MKMIVLSLVALLALNSTSVSAKNKKAKTEKPSVEVQKKEKEVAARVVQFKSLLLLKAAHKKKDTLAYKYDGDSKSITLLTLNGTPVLVMDNYVQKLYDYGANGWFSNEKIPKFSYAMPFYDGSVGNPDGDSPNEVVNYPYWDNSEKIAALNDYAHILDYWEKFLKTPTKKKQKK